VVVTPVEAFLPEVEVFDVTFPGFGGDPVKGWFVLPRSGGDALPAVVEYNGYGGGRGFPHERLAWVAAGYAYFFMDTRGQGSVWGSGGETADPHGSGPSTPGFMTRGIESAETYYYRRVYTDAVRAIDAVRGLSRVDPDRIAVCGGSQGGGIAIAAAGLSDGIVAAMPEVPFLQHFERAVGLTASDPYFEIVRYLSAHRGAEARTFATLAYFDGISFARRATCPALYSVGIMDPVCPPSTVFASANQWAGGATVIEYPFNEHEGGQGYHWREQAQLLRGVLA
jgi:cephalosporin-C deacetylase